MNWTPEATERLTAYLTRPGYRIPMGIGTARAACSLAAINLALTGELTDDVPPCMSEVIGRWIVTTQDLMPADLRNSTEWKSLLPLAAGTGRDREQERLAVAMEWMDRGLKMVQGLADQNGYGDEWRKMLEERTCAAAYDAYSAAYDASSAASSAKAAYAASVAASVYASAACAAAALADVSDAATASAKAATAAYASDGWAVDRVAAWAALNPIDCLKRMIAS